MRITSQMSDRSFLDTVGRLNEQLDILTQQVTSGKKLLGLRESPGDSARLVALRAELARIDQYNKNADSVSFYLGVADTALESAHNLVTSIYIKGSSVASGGSTADTRSFAAKEIRALRDQILSLANTQAEGRYVFGGSQVGAEPFSIVGDTVTYEGDSITNSIEIGESLDVRQGIPGDEAFASAFESIQDLLEALDGNDVDAIKAALAGFTTALSDLNNQRGIVGSGLGAAQNAKLEQDNRTTSLERRRSILEDADLAEAITSLERIQNQIRAVLTVKTIAQQRNLFDLIG